MSSENKERKLVDKSKRRRMNGFEEWGGYMASKKMKLSAQFDCRRDMEIEDQGETSSEIFKGISIFVNGYTKPSADELKRLMLIHGGIYHHYYSTTKTTHTIASNLPYSKIKNLKNQIVVTPDWITDSIKQGKLLPYQNYLLCTPEATNNQQRLNFQNFLESKVTEEETSTYHKPVTPSVHQNPADVDNGTQTSTSNVKNLPNKLNGTSFAVTNIPSTSAINNTTLQSRIETPVSAGHPDFLSEFYNHSRLHHISSSSQELKRYVRSLVENHDTKTFPGREHIKNLVRTGSLPKEQVSFLAAGDKITQVIMHLDMDCFFVSVGLRKHPELKGKPVAVTHSKGKRGGPQEGSNVQYEASYYANQSKQKLSDLISDDCDISDSDNLDEVEKQKISKYSKDYGSLSEVASCSYEAREAGVRNGMLLGEAMRRCPNLKTVPYDFDGYSEVSKQLYDIAVSYTLDIEAISCDELYIDCTKLLQDTGISPLQFASVLRSEVEQKTKCTASAGLGANMLIARLANRIAKPNGQHYVPNDQIEDFIVKQKVKDLPGVGYTTSDKFEQMGVSTCGDLQKWSIAKLQQEFGPKTGQTLYKRCRGKDNRVVQLQKERKSVSAEINYGIRFEKEEDIYKFLNELSAEVANRARNINCKGKSITLKLMIRHPDAPVQTAKFMGHGVCDHIAKTVSLKSATDDPVLIGNECCTLAKCLKIKPEDYRGIGIQLSKLESLHKDTRNFKSIESFICGNANNTDQNGIAKEEILAQKEFVKKSIAKTSSIKNFLMDKPSINREHTEPEAFSLEQLDQSVLNALPDDLQKEVLELYGKRNSFSSSSHQHSSTSTHPVLPQLKPNTCAVKKSVSASKTKNKVLNKQNTLHECMAPAKSVSHCDKEETIFKNKASLGGAEDINEVRNLVKEWVLSSQVVLEEDVDQFRDYVLQMIDEDLKKADLVLKYFYRVASTANALWQQAYLTVLSYVQQKMLQKFGTMLEAKNDFSA